MAGPTLSKTLSSSSATPAGASPSSGQPSLLRAVGRWELVGLSVNDVIGSGIYLLPAAAAALLGVASLWAVLLAGIAVALLVLCYAQAASYFDQPGGSILYAREAFGPFVGFEVGQMLLLARIASAAALSHGLAEALSHFWPAATDGPVHTAIIVVSLAFLITVNVIGVRAAARTGVVLSIAKILPLLMFIGIGAFFVDMSVATPVSLSEIPMSDLGKGALLLLFAYAGFENMPTAAGEYRNPKRDIPFAMITMIVVVSLIYFGVQWVALGTLPGLAESLTPLADASAQFGGMWLAAILTVGAAVSILGTNSNTIMFGPRYLHAMVDELGGPAWLARIHPRFRTPAVAIIVVGVLSLALALSGSFVYLALLSVVARLVGYLGTAISVLVLRKRDGHLEGALKLVGGPVIPVVATLLSLALLASAGITNVGAAIVALIIGAVLYLIGRAVYGSARR